MFFFRTALVFFFPFSSSSLSIVVSETYFSEKKRVNGLGNVINKECEFSVSLETKNLVFLRLHKRFNDWKKNLKVTT